MRKVYLIGHLDEQIVLGMLQSRRTLETCISVLRRYINMGDDSFRNLDWKYIIIHYSLYVH